MTVMPACANCGTALNGPYCSNCGQKASDLHRPFWWIAGEFLDAVFGYDSRTFRTLWLLFAEPGEFTRRYNAGQRASLLPPFRLFLIATIVFFLTLTATGVAMVSFKTTTVDVSKLSPQVVAEMKRDANFSVERDGKMSSVEMRFFVPRSAIQSNKLTPEQLKNLEAAREAVRVETTGEPDADGWLKWISAKGERVVQGYQHALADPMLLNGPLNVWLPRLMLVLVPVFAFLLAIMHWYPRVFLYEHLIFSLHIHTVLFVALSLAALGAAILGDSSFLWAIWLILLVYVFMAMLRVYGRSWWLTGIKLLVLIMVYSLVMTAGLGVIFLLALSEV